MDILVLFSSLEYLLIIKHRLSYITSSKVFLPMVFQLVLGINEQ